MSENEQVFTLGHIGNMKRDLGLQSVDNSLPGILSLLERHTDYILDLFAHQLSQTSAGDILAEADRLKAAGDEDMAEIYEKNGRNILRDKIRLVSMAERAIEVAGKSTPKLDQLLEKTRADIAKYQNRLE